MTDNNDLIRKIEDLERQLRQYQQTCPSCGYCPTCGRRNQYRPWYVPYYPSSPYWSVTTGGAFQATGNQVSYSFSQPVVDWNPVTQQEGLRPK